MPLYSELSFYLPNNSVYAANRSPISSSPYSPFSRLNPYTSPPPVRPIIYGKYGQFKPMLTSISESTGSPSSLTRINSAGKSSYNSFFRTPGAYIPPRPIHIDTADIDVTATRFHKHRNHRVRSTSPEQQHTKADGDKKSNADDADGSVFMPRVDQNDPNQTRSTIKRDRNIVRLSTMRQRSQSKPAKADRADSIKKVHRPESTVEPVASPPIESDTKSTAKKSWRDKFGDSLQTNAPKVARKTPGELILERHIIRDKNDSLKIPVVDAPQSTPTIVRIPENVTSQEITYLEPLIRKSIRRQSLISCPSFKDICKDISSDIKDQDDDLNAGELRRRVSLILEQEGQIIAQLTSMRRPSADVTVDKTIAEENPISDENEKDAPATTIRSNTDDTRKGEADSVTDAPTSENVIVIKKKTKKKGGKLKHKITVTIEVENSNAAKTDSVAEKPTAPAESDTENNVSTKISPTWRAVVEDIQEDITLNLPKKSPKKAAATKKPEVGHRESILLKKKIDLKRNEMEIVEYFDKTDDADAAKKSSDTKMQISTTDETTSNGVKAKTEARNRLENMKKPTTPPNDLKDCKKANETIKAVAAKPVNSNTPTPLEHTTTAKPTQPIERNRMESCSGNTSKAVRVENTAIRVEKLMAAKAESPCNEHKQTEQIDSGEPTATQATNLNLETRPQASTETKPEQLVKSTSATTTSSSSKTQKPITSTANAINESVNQPKPKTNVKKATDKNTTSNKTIDNSQTTPIKPKIAQKVGALKSISKSLDSEINADRTHADRPAATAAPTKSNIALTAPIESPRSIDHGNDNDNESQSNQIGVGANVTRQLSADSDTKSRPFEHCVAAARSADDNDDSSNSNGSSGSIGGGLSKFATVANLNSEFEIERTIVNDRTHNNNDKSAFSTRSIAESCISAGEQIDLLLDFLSTSEQSCSSDSESEDEMGQKRRPKKRKEKLHSRRVIKLDPKRKCYITDESAKYPLIATPRPLVKRSEYCGRNYAESESESETSSDICSSDECYDECLSPNDVVAKDGIRMSTCSNDSGFDGGSSGGVSAPSSPKKMLGKQNS